MVKKKTETNPDKKILTRAGLEKIQQEYRELKDYLHIDIAQKLKEAREQGDLSENAEYDAAKDEQRDVQARLDEIDRILKNVEVIDEDEIDIRKITVGSTVKLLDKEFDEDLEFTIVGAVEANSSLGLISNESPLGKALIGHKKNDNVKVDAPAGIITYKVLEITRK